MNPKYSLYSPRLIWSLPPQWLPYPSPYHKQHIYRSTDIRKWDILHVTHHLDTVLKISNLPIISNQHYRYHTYQHCAFTAADFHWVVILRFLTLNYIWKFAILVSDKLSCLITCIPNFPFSLHLGSVVRESGRWDYQKSVFVFSFPSIKELTEYNHIMNHEEIFAIHNKHSI